MKTLGLHVDVTTGFAAGGATALFLFYIIKRLIREKLVHTLTALNDIHNLGSPRPGKRLEGTAVICGGGVAGLWAARVCADHFEDVLIIDPEKWLSEEAGRSPRFDETGMPKADAVTRKRVMQYNAIHGFQPFTCIALKKLHPNIEQIYKQNGAAMAFPIFNIHFDGIPFDKFPYEAYPNGDYPLVPIASRDTFERTLRNLFYTPGGRIRWLTGTVTGVHSLPERLNRVDYVTVRTDDSKEELDISASLVVDCSGGSQAGFNLQHLEEKRVMYDPKLHYAMKRVPLSPEMRQHLPIPGGYEPAKGFLYAYVPHYTKDYRSVTLESIEGHQMDVGLALWGDHTYPKSLSDTIDWVKTFNATRPIPDWIFKTLETLQEAEEHSFHGEFHMPPCSWIHYESISNLPSNFAVIGDAQMRANPIFGQGCSKALIGALTLDHLLRKVPKSRSTLPDNFGEKYFRLHSSRIGPLWDGTKPTDYGFETTIPCEGEKLTDGWFSRKYSDLLTELILQGDKKVNSVVWHVRNFLAPPTDVFDPVIIAKVAILALRQATGLA